MSLRYDQLEHVRPYHSAARISTNGTSYKIAEADTATIADPELITMLRNIIICNTEFFDVVCTFFIVGGNSTTAFLKVVVLKDSTTIALQTNAPIILRGNDELKMKSERYDGAASSSTAQKVHVNVMGMEMQGGND